MPPSSFAQWGDPAFQLLSYNKRTDLAMADPGMDLSYEFVLLTYAAIAWYHHKPPAQPAAAAA